MFEEEREDEGVKTTLNGTSLNMAKKTKKAAIATRKKVKGQSKARRRTVNPKKAKKGDRQQSGVGEGVAGEEDSSDEQLRKGTGGRSQQKPHEESCESSEEEEVGVANKVGEDEEWSRLQESVQKHSKKKFEGNKTESHPVHAPHFPEVRLL